MSNVLILDYTHEDCFPPKMSIGDKRFGASYDEAISFLRGNGIKKVQFKYFGSEPANRANFEGMFKSCLSFSQN